VPAAICVIQPILPAAITSGLTERHCDFALTQPVRKLLWRMLYVPAEPQHKPSGTLHETVEQFFRTAPLSMRNGGSGIRDEGDWRARSEPRQILADIERELETRGPLRIGRIGAQHVAVVLDRRAAARGGDRDGIEPPPFPPPGVDARGWPALLPRAP
jgi:hypothetical protein